MPIVNEPVVLSENSLAIIRAKISEPGYCHTNWSCLLYTSELPTKA